MKFVLIKTGSGKKVSKIPRWLKTATPFTCLVIIFLWRHVRQKKIKSNFRHTKCDSEINVLRKLDYSLMKFMRKTEFVKFVYTGQPYGVLYCCTYDSPCALWNQRGVKNIFSRANALKANKFYNYRNFQKLGKWCSNLIQSNEVLSKYHKKHCINLCLPKTESVLSPNI